MAHGNMLSDSLHILNETDFYDVDYDKCLNRVLRSPCLLSNTWEVIHFPWIEGMSLWWSFIRVGWSLQTTERTAWRGLADFSAVHYCRSCSSRVANSSEVGVEREGMLVTCLVVGPAHEELQGCAACHGSTKGECGVYDKLFMVEKTVYLGNSWGPEVRGWAVRLRGMWRHMGAICLAPACPITPHLPPAATGPTVM